MKNINKFKIRNVMRKLLMNSIFIAIIAIAGFNVYSLKKDQKLSGLILTNIEALADPRESVVGNTGPGEIKKCVGHAGHKKYCLSENNHPCTESACE